MTKRYCFKCKKNVESKDYGAGEFCSECFNYLDGRSGLSSVTREASRNSDLREVELREESTLRSEALEQASLEETLEDLFLSMGLSESAAKHAAKGRSGLGNNTKEYVEKLKALKPGALKEALDKDGLEDLFRSIGLSESAAKIAAKGRR